MARAAHGAVSRWEIDWARSWTAEAPDASRGPSPEDGSRQHREESSSPARLFVGRWWVEVSGRGALAAEGHREEEEASPPAEEGGSPSARSRLLARLWIKSGTLAVETEDRCLRTMEAARDRIRLSSELYLLIGEKLLRGETGCSIWGLTPDE